MKSSDGIVFVTHLLEKPEDAMDINLAEYASQYAATPSAWMLEKMQQFPESLKDFLAKNGPYYLIVVRKVDRTFYTMVSADMLPMMIEIL